MPYYTVPDCNLLLVPAFEQCISPQNTACNTAAYTYRTACLDDLRMVWLNLQKDLLQAMQFVLEQADINSVTTEAVKQ